MTDAIHELAKLTLVASDQAYGAEKLLPGTPLRAYQRLKGPTLRGER